MVLVPPIIYAVLLVAGFAGFVAMLLLGSVHEVHGHHGHGAHGHGGHTHGGHHGHAHTAHGHGHSHDNANADGDADGDGDGDGDAASTIARGFMWVIPFLSPLNWFSWFLGAGAAGTLLTLAHIQDPLRLIGALVGAILFKVAIVGPIWNNVFKFASKPADNLEGCLMQTVEAVTAFNERGEGLVRMLIDGRSEDVLARLTEADLARGGRVGRGTQLLVEEVDPSRNTCRVSRV